MSKKMFLTCSGMVLLTVMSLGQTQSSVDSPAAVVDQYCMSCHNDSSRSGGFSFSEFDLDHPETNAAQAERIIRKVRSGMMPPAGSRRPQPEVLSGLAAAIEGRVDQAAAAEPYVDAPDLHRVNRTEYRNSVRDLLGIDVDVDNFLPADTRSGAFDNLADGLTITPTLMQGYIRAAEKIARDAVGDPQASASMISYSVPKVYNQYRRVEGAPFGTRGGLSLMHTFPADGEYTFKLQLYYYYTGTLVGSKLPESLQGQELEVSVDGARVAVFTIDPEIQETEGDLVTEPISITAGPHRVTAAFVSKFDGPVEDQYWLIEQTLMDVSVANQAGVTSLPHLRGLFITGPMNVAGVSETPSRRKIFTCRPNEAAAEEACAVEIISRLARQAFRRPVVAEDMEGLMVQYHLGRQEGDFETGIRTALQAILAKPEFVFRFERVPAGIGPGETFRISDLELASRLSYFLWSSAPDEQLIGLASQGRLQDPAILEQQVRRMLQDPRSEAMSTNFGGQWLRLQGIQDALPDAGLFPNYTRNLAESMRREVELLFDSIKNEDRSVLDILTADYTYVDEVLAKHYGIPNVLGTRFQRVALSDPSRFGVLGKAGVLTMTSLAHRTSPVARGKYVLEVLVGSPPPAPPPVVPPLSEVSDNQKALSVRERMEQHRDNAACRACHQIMDPIGMAMENYDAIGLWRDSDLGYPIDASGQMYDGSSLDGPVSVQKAVLSRSNAFLSNFTENLFSYAVGRVLDHNDMPTVRAIAKEAAAEENRFSAFVLGIVNSPAFQMSRNHNSTMQE